MQLGELRAGDVKVKLPALFTQTLPSAPDAKSVALVCLYDKICVALRDDVDTKECSANVVAYRLSATTLARLALFRYGVDKQHLRRLVLGIRPGWTRIKLTTAINAMRAFVELHSGNRETNVTMYHLVVQLYLEERKLGATTSDANGVFDMFERFYKRSFTFPELLREMRHQALLLRMIRDKNVDEHIATVFGLRCRAYLSADHIVAFLLDAHSNLVGPRRAQLRECVETETHVCAEIVDLMFHYTIQPELEAGVRHLLENDYISPIAFARQLGSYLRSPPGPWHRSRIHRAWKFFYPQLSVLALLREWILLGGPSVATEIAAFADSLVTRIHDPSKSLPTDLSALTDSKHGPVAEYNVRATHYRQTVADTTLPLVLCDIIIGYCLHITSAPLSFFRSLSSQTHQKQKIAHKTHVRSASFRRMPCDAQSKHDPSPVCMQFLALIVTSTFRLRLLFFFYFGIPRTCVCVCVCVNVKLLMCRKCPNQRQYPTLVTTLLSNNLFYFHVLILNVHSRQKETGCRGQGGGGRRGGTSNALYRRIFSLQIMIAATMYRRSIGRDLNTTSWYVQPV
jgi:hypothetical protein